MSASSKFARYCGPLAPTIFFILESLVVFSLFRIAFIAWLWTRVEAVDGLWPVLGYGLRFDILISCFIIALPVVLSLLLPDLPRIQRGYRCLEAAWFSLWLGIFVYMETATPSYINQYDSRPGRIFYEYLNHPKEVFSTLWADYKLQLVIGLLLFTLAFLFSLKTQLRISDHLHPWRWHWRLLMVPLCGALIFLGARSSLDHRPANISTAAFSNDQLVNRLGVNSTYSLFYALTNISNEGHAEQLYQKMDSTTILAQIRQQVGIAPQTFSSKSVPTLHHQVPTKQRQRPLNIVIILEESLGAEFVASLNGKDWTPQLDKLSEQGLWLSRLYATGTRSVRGIEAVISGFPPSPGRSVVKLGLAQQHFFTLAQLLKKRGYTSSFIYGGESNFDNMRGFFLGNGFDRVIDQKDYSNPQFIGTWGVSDEDLFARADQEFRAAGDQPFLSLVFTSSNHEPYDIPQGIVKKGTGQNARFEEAVRYADYALGKFFEQARQSPYWDNTLFLVVADHDKRVFGNKLVPIEKFHIPGLFIGPGVAAKQIDKIASQIDLPVTLLSLAGIEADHPMIGRDLTQLTAKDPGLAIMQFGLNHATMVGDQVIIHQPHLLPRQFRYANGKLLPETLDPVFAEDATALALWPSAAYFQQQYRLPKPKTELAHKNSSKHVRQHG